MDIDTPERPDDAVSFRFQDLPPEIRDMVWIIAAEWAADAFRQRYPDFNRFWYSQHKPPYILFTAHTMDDVGDPDPSVLRGLRDLFRTLFLTNKESCKIVGRYISKFHERKKAPQLALNFVDIFPMGTLSLDNIIRFSKRSSPALQSQIPAGHSIPFPPMLQTAYEAQLEEVTAVMNPSVLGSIFTRSEANRARQLMLLRFINLRRLYIDVEGLHHGVSKLCLEPYHKSRVTLFVELSEYRAGQFRMKHGSFGSFSKAFRDRHRGSGVRSRYFRRVCPAVEAWRDVQA
ncbi:hypothetical protein F4814DRAFT_427474 [Daldinia grandis]|nr:hypothetical protein F4814DRAFT_427474 [Daldinia grandis]